MDNTFRTSKGGGKGCLPPTNFETPHCTPLKIFKNTLEYSPKFTLLQNKSLDVPVLGFS